MSAVGSGRSGREREPGVVGEFEVAATGVATDEPALLQGDDGGRVEFVVGLGEHAGALAMACTPEFAVTSRARCLRETITPCQVAQLLAEQLGFDADTRRPLTHIFERWDGKGMPGGLPGAAIALPARRGKLAPAGLACGAPACARPAHVRVSRTGCARSVCRWPSCRLCRLGQASLPAARGGGAGIGRRSRPRRRPPARTLPIQHLGGTAAVLGPRRSLSFLWSDCAVVLPSLHMWNDRSISARSDRSRVSRRQIRCQQAGAI